MRKITPLLVGISIAGTVIGWGAWLGARGTTTRRATADNLHVKLLRRSPGRAPLPVPAEAAKLADDAPVVGVTAGHRSRAYALGAFADVDRHVMNDVLGGTAVTVAHCPGSGCTRVYTDPHRSEPLPVAVGGWAGKPGLAPGADSVMLLRVETNHYFQDTGEALEGPGEFPFPEGEFTQTTWKEWREAHPDTDVVTMPDENH